MSAALLETIAEDGLRCPTCGAKQPWSESCRRCKCDLALLRRVAETWRHDRRRCLQALHAGRIADALRHARRCFQLNPDPSSVRLLAVCHLLGGDWPQSVALAQTAENGRQIAPAGENATVGRQAR